MASRRAFTLLELLVVISVIAVLAGLLIPTIGLVRHLVSDLKCGNNLQQIASAMEAYKSENTDQFPDHMIGDPSNLTNTNPTTSNLVSVGGPLAGLAKVFLCPYDSLNGGGTDKDMGRGLIDVGANSKSGLYDGGMINSVAAYSSYCFEASAFPLDKPNTESSSYYFTSSDYAALLASLPAGMAPTMYMAKHNELLFGVSDGGSNYSGAFAPSMFPIIRCFFHLKWNSLNQHQNKVLNISWDLSVIKTIPWWETTINPNIGP
jgi:prepilin-type N-terminal cleavage/methylation domain-containing protein